MTIEITIPGLNARQCMIADILWAFEDGKDADRYISSLPTVPMRQEAQSIKDLMLMAAMEQCYDGIEEPLDAKAFLSTLTIRKI